MTDKSLNIRNGEELNIEFLALDNRFNKLSYINLDIFDPNT